MTSFCSFLLTNNSSELYYNECIETITNLQEQQQQIIINSTEVSKSIFILLSSFMIMFMQAGFAMLEAGAVRARNAKSILIKNLLDLCVTILVWWLWGYALFSNQYIHIGVLRWNDAQSWIHTVCFASASATIISGSIAERMKLPVYLIMVFVFSGIIYPLTGYWVWNENSFLKKWGYLDFAGGAVVHMSGGVAALVGAAMVGPRLHKFVVENGKVTSKDLQAHSPIISALGTFILLFGWLSFNASSTNEATKESLQVSARAVANSVLCPATAGLMSVIIHQHKMGVHSLSTLYNAIIGGAVAVTAGCAYYESWSSIVLGIITALVNYYGPHLMISLQIDDPLDAFVCHGLNGLVGLLGVGVFAYKDFVPEGHRYGIFYSGGSLKLLGIQIAGSLFLIVFCVIVMWLTLLITEWYYIKILSDKDGLRIDKTAEILGMDVKYYDGYAYPDFNKSKVLQFNDVKEAELKVQRMNIKKKEVIVTAFEENPIWKYFSKQPFSSSSISSNPSQSNDRFNHSLDSNVSTRNNTSQTTASRRTTSEEEEVRADLEDIPEDIVHEISSEDNIEEFKLNTLSRTSSSHHDKPMLTISLLDPVGDLEEISRHSRNNSILGISSSESIE